MLRFVPNMLVPSTPTPHPPAQAQETRAEEGSETVMVQHGDP